MVALNQQNPLLAMSILRTTFPTKSSKNVHTDPTEAEAAMVAAEAAAMVAAEAAAMVAAEAAATAVAAVAEATVEAAEEDTVAAETADATSTKREYQPSVANIS
jgi:hypothetical protein